MAEATEQQVAIISVTVSAFFPEAPEEFTQSLVQQIAEVVAGNLDRQQVVACAFIDLQQLAPGDGLYEKIDLCTATATGLSQNFLEWQRGLEGDVFERFPALELVPITAKTETVDWAARWESLGGKMFAGRMIASKSIPIWTAIGFFGLPFPPFDLGSGMGVKEVTFEEVERLRCDIYLNEATGLDFDVSTMRSRIETYFQMNPPQT